MTMNTFNPASVSAIASGPGANLSRARVAEARAQATSVPTFAPQVALLGEIGEGWQLIKPLVVNFEADDSQWIVSDDEFALFGVGETRTAAASDYVAALIEYYQLLARYDDPPSAALFSHLQSFLTATV